MSPSPAATRTSLQLGAYFGAVMLTLGLAEPAGLVNLPLLFWLKDGLHLTAGAIAVFEAIVLAPLYAGFVLGFVRDRWTPLGGSDRRIFLLGAPFAILAYAWLASGPLSWGRLLLGVTTAALAFDALNTSAEAMMTVMAQRHRMTGGLSAVSEVAEVIPSVLALLAGGWMATHMAPQSSLWLAAALTGVVMLVAARQPRVVVTTGREGPSERHRDAIARIVRDKALWPVIVMLFLWNFSPGWGTPIVFYLSDRLGMSPEAFGAFRAAQFASGALVAVLYTLLCRRVSLRRILGWSLALNVPLGFVLFAAGSGGEAVVIASVLGVGLGLVNIALFDLLRRACPTYLEGSGVMLGYSVFTLGGTVGDVFGSWLYMHGGMVACVACDAAANAALLGMLARVPRHLLAPRDGEVAADDGGLAGPAGVGGALEGAPG